MTDASAKRWMRLTLFCQGQPIGVLLSNDSVTLADAPAGLLPSDVAVGHDRATLAPDDRVLLSMGGTAVLAVPPVALRLGTVRRYASLAWQVIRNRIVGLRHGLYC